MVRLGCSRVVPARVRSEAATAGMKWTKIKPKAKRDENSTANVSPIAGSPVLSRSQRKNQRRKEARKRRDPASGSPSSSPDPEYGWSGESSMMEMLEPEQYSDVDAVLARALEASLDSQPSVAAATPHKRVKSLQKKLRAIAELEARAAAEGAGCLNEAERQKIGKKSTLTLDLAEAQAVVASHKAEAAAAVAENHDAMLRVTGVEFDMDKFGCPICREAMEAATTVLPCGHTFCRECLEQALQHAVDVSSDDLVLQCPEDVWASCCCPMCRYLYCMRAS